MLRKLWSDEAGFIISTELILVATIVVIGLIVGLVSVRNQVVQELVQVGQAIGAISQSYAFTPVEATVAGHSYAWTDGSEFICTTHYCQAPQVPGVEPGGISVHDWGPFYVSPTFGELTH
jgi:hypothetical protein